MSRYAIILAAGRGERLWPLTSTRPKPLLPLPDGSTLLTRILDLLQGVVDGVVVVVSRDFTGEVTRRYLASKGYNVYYAVQEEARGTGDAVKAALEALPSSADELLIVYGDTLVEREALRFIASEEPPALLAAKSERPWEYGVLEVDEKGCLRRVREKPADAKPGSLVNAGVYLLERSDVEEYIFDIRLSPRGELEFTDVIQGIAKRKCLRVISGEWSWLDVGRPWDVFKAYRVVWRERYGDLREPLIEGEVEPGAKLIGPVYVARGAVVRSYSIIEGPAWIGGEVGPFARVRPWTFILEGAKALTHVEVKASILLYGARAPHLNYVGDSILGENVNLGAGTITANLRFDHKTIKMELKGRLIDTGLKKLGAVLGDYAQTGINVSLLPGVRVGAYSWVYPGAIVSRDVPDCVLARPGPEGMLVFEDISSRAGCPSYLMRKLKL